MAALPEAKRGAATPPSAGLPGHCRISSLIAISGSYLRLEQGTNETMLADFSALPSFFLNFVGIVVGIIAAFIAGAFLANPRWRLAAYVALCVSASFAVICVVWMVQLARTANAEPTPAAKTEDFQPTATPGEKEVVGPKDVRLPVPVEPKISLLVGNFEFPPQKCGYIDTAGREVIPARWEEADVFSEGLAVVRSKGKYGYIDRTGKTVIAAHWGTAGPFSEGRAWVTDGSGFGCIDTSGKVVSFPQWDFASDFSEGRAQIQSNGKFGFIDRSGNVIIPPIWEGAHRFSEGMALVGANLHGSNPIYRFIDLQGQIVVSDQQQHIAEWSGFSERLSPLKIGGKWGVMTMDWRLVIPPKFDWIGAFSEGLAAVGLDKQVGYIDRGGTLAIPARWDFGGEFSGGVAQVTLQSKRGVIDRLGQVVIPIAWDSADLHKAEDGKTYIRLARVKSGVPRPTKGSETAPAEVRWVDSTGKIMWQSP
jgi:hypothetical protein